MSALLNTVFTIALFIAGTLLAAIVDITVARRFSTSQAPASIASLFGRLREPDPGHRRIDKLLFRSAAPLALAVVIVGMIVIPVDSHTASLPGAQLNVGVFFYLVVLDLMAVALFIAGWGANQQKGTDGAFVAGAQLISYIIPLGFAVTGAAMAAQSLSAAEVVGAQQGWPFGIWQPFGFAIYVLAAMGQTYRPPVNLPLAGRDSNVLVEHRGAGDALMRIALYAIWFGAAAMGTVLFLGGWQGPFLPDVVWFFIKTSAVLALMAYLAQRLKPVTTHQMLRFAWLILIPASIANIILVGLILMVRK